MQGNRNKKPVLIRILRAMSFVIPGNYLKTLVFLNLIHRPRKILRNLLNSFYRMEHVYEVLKEFIHQYRGNFSILEFGVADGYAFTKMLYATRYMRCADRVMVHGFDTFEGLPKTEDKRDADLITGDNYFEGQFKTDFDHLKAYCASRYSNFQFHRGLFDRTLTNEFLFTLRESLPILVWIDCDFYTSAKSVFERIIPYLPNGCVVYFDEPEINFGSIFTGEARIIHEINNGQFAEGIELVLDTTLSLNSRRIYRFINVNANLQYDAIEKPKRTAELHRRTNDSPFP